MGRIFKHNKPPKTTISISVDLWDRIHQKKWRGITYDQFLERIFSEWIDLKEAYSMLQITLEFAQKRNQEYEREISELKSKLHDTEQKVTHA